MDLIVVGLQWLLCLVYIDNVIILFVHLRTTLTIYKKSSNIYVRLDLSSSHTSTFISKLMYLIHIISRGVIAADPYKVNRVAFWPLPKLRKEIQRFLGLARYYHWFLWDSAMIAKPLHYLNEQTIILQWTPKCQIALEQLCQLLNSSQILAYPDFIQVFILDTDASEFGIGGE